MIADGRVIVGDAIVAKGRVVNIEDFFVARNLMIVEK